MFGTITSKLKSWYTQPYQSNMDVLHWFIFLGLLLTLMAGWRIILGHIVRET